MNSILPLLRLWAAAAVRFRMWGLDVMAPDYSRLRIRLHELENPR